VTAAAICGAPGIEVVFPDIKSGLIVAVIIRASKCHKVCAIGEVRSAERVGRKGGGLVGRLVVKVAARDGCQFGLIDCLDQHCCDAVFDWGLDPLVFSTYFIARMASQLFCGCLQHFLLLCDGLGCYCFVFALPSISVY
jgi:hypothetical protein